MGLKHQFKLYLQQFRVGFIVAIEVKQHPICTLQNKFEQAQHSYALCYSVFPLSETLNLFIITIIYLTALTTYVAEEHLQAMLMLCSLNIFR